MHKIIKSIEITKIKGRIKKTNQPFTDPQDKDEDEE